MFYFVIFKCFSSCITFEEKAKFGEMCRHEIGRLWFARSVNCQVINIFS